MNQSYEVDAPIMHLKEGDSGSPKEERITKDTEENVHNVLDESNEPKSAHVETDDKITDEPQDTTHLVSEKSTSDVVEQHVNPSEKECRLSYCRHNCIQKFPTKAMLSHSRRIMHLKEGDSGFPKEERITKDTEENVHNVLDESNEPKSAHVETDDKITEEPQDTTHLVSVKSTSDVVEQHVNPSEKGTSDVVAQHLNPSNGDQVQEADGTYTNTEYAEQYNVLLNQYNAVEEQRQKLLQQLYQYGSWDYQGYSYGAAYDSQYQTVPAPQTSEPPVCSCRPYVCPYSTAAVSSSETCVGSTTLAHKGNSVSLKDDEFIKSAMEAVDRAIHSFNKETSEGKKEEKVASGSGEILQDKSSQTDLSAVLNAWFSAGFYTGKYLSEQASAKK
ncbi:hypothetical protein CTI12_AA049000 [Artemisia annua]|uniref:Uncharacterized protein n=1 Tax=Artemisia annua TaxID=35608 RepID=A0A2U1PGQ0_ARTAN|nr:hypothetical protein CTI12_AA049000 [Artemisia annua]